MTINARLDEIAKEAANKIDWEGMTYGEMLPVIRAAIDKAIEVVLTAEPRNLVDLHGSIEDAAQAAASAKSSQTAKARQEIAKKQESFLVGQCS